MSSPVFVLTFGVELEFIVRYDPEYYKDQRLDADTEENLWWEDENLSLHHKNGILVRNHMIEILNEYGFPTNSYKEANTDFSKWTVDTDESVSSSVDDNTSGNYWHAIELKTPVLRSSCKKASLDLIEAAIKLLVSKFRLFTNETCGLHVHVGNEDRGFDLRTLKNFCSLIVAFDHQLESLHPPNRIQNPYAKSTRAMFPRRGGTTTPLAEKLRMIDELQTLDDLVLRFHRTEDGDNDKHMAYNFFNLQFYHDTLGKPLRTIEFRQHRGTLDPLLIANWITIVCGLVENSYYHHNRHEEDFFQTLFDKSHDSVVYTVTNLLKALQLNKQAAFYHTPFLHRYGYGASRTPDPAAALDTNPSSGDEDQEPLFIDTSFPGQYDTPWEKEFAPRPPCES